LLKIAFVMPHWTTVFGGYSKVAGRASSFPPLNLAMLAALAEAQGHRALIVDAEIEQLTSEQTIERLKAFGPDFVGFTATTPIFSMTSDWASRVRKELEVPVGIGGFHVTLFGSEAFHDHFDVAFLGEADRSFDRFLAHFGDLDAYARIPGLMFRKEGRVISTGIAEPSPNLDVLPPPARHLLKTERYRVGSLKGTLNYTSIMASRGCPFKCVFCTNQISGTRVRRRSVAHVVEEIVSVVKRHGVRHFYFVDDVLTLNRGYMLELCAAIAREKLEITFEGSTRANLVDDALMAAMRRAGLIRLSFGLESADESIREIIRKDVPLEAYADACRIATRQGVETITSAMLGLPGDTRESIGRTIRYLRDTRELKHSTLSIAMPYPGTELHGMALRGEHGLELLSHDYSRYQRYGSAVMAVNGISPEMLLRLQKIGLLKIYLAPWRLIPVLRRMGFRSLLMPFASALVSCAQEASSRIGRRIASLRFKRAGTG
jgi:radical SAM superfamily enzyme YgiQ (UPF0313 family)